MGQLFMVIHCFQNTPWTCSLCSTANTTKAKACKECGARRTHADKTQQSRHWHQHAGHHINAGLESVNAQIMAHSGGDGSKKPSNGQPKKEDLEAKIRHLEGALAGIPDDPLYSGIRTSISEDIRLTKQKITQSRPLGVQLESAKAALVCASTRRSNAENAVAETRDCYKQQIRKLWICERPSSLWKHRLPCSPMPNPRRK